MGVVKKNTCKWHHIAPQNCCKMPIAHCHHDYILTVFGTDEKRQCFDQVTTV